MSLEQALFILRDLSWSVYSGTFLAYAAYLSFLPIQKRNEQVRSLMNTGVVLGLAFGVLIFDVLLTRWLDLGHYYPVSDGELIAFAVAGALWCSNIVFEIWTLDPIRKVHQGVLLEKVDVQRSFDRCYRHLIVHAALIVSTHVSFAVLA